MADHQITSRLWNLWNGFLSLWVQKKENAHPEIAYQNSIQSMSEKYLKLKHAAGRIIARRDEIGNKLNTARSDLAQVGEQLNAALATEQDDLALVLLQKKSALDEHIRTLEGEFAVANKDAEDMKNQLLEVKAEIDKLKAEKDRMVGLLQSAEARIQIQSSLDGLSIDAEVQALSGVRDHIKGRVAEANLGAELRESDLDVRMKTLTRSAGTITARAQLEEMKKARAAAQALPAGGKTL